MPAHRDAARVMADQCLCFRARRVSRALTRIYDDELRPLGIQATQLTLLGAIALAGGRGGAMRALADALGMDGTTLSRNLRPLESAGLVRIERGASDRRVRLAVLTPAGERVVADARPLWERAHARIVAALGDRPAADLRDRLDATAAASAAVAGRAETTSPRGAS